jgi:hypothetical protein
LAESETGPEGGLTGIGMLTGLQGNGYGRRNG